MPVGFNEPTALGRETTALVARSVGWAVAGWGSPPAQTGEIYIHCQSAPINTAEFGLKLKPGCRSNGNYVNSTPLLVERAKDKSGRCRMWSELIRPFGDSEKASGKSCALQGKAAAEVRTETGSKPTVTVKPQPQGEVASVTPAT